MLYVGQLPEYVPRQHPMKGFLYFNQDGEEKGSGDGGLFAKLKGAPELGVDDFTIV